MNTSCTGSRTKLCSTLFLHKDTLTKCERLTHPPCSSRAASWRGRRRGSRCSLQPRCLQSPLALCKQTLTANQVVSTRRWSVWQELWWTWQNDNYRNIFTIFLSNEWMGNSWYRAFNCRSLDPSVVLGVGHQRLQSVGRDVARNCYVCRGTERIKQHLTLEINTKVSTVNAAGSGGNPQKETYYKHRFHFCSRLCSLWWSPVDHRGRFHSRPVPRGSGRLCRSPEQLGPRWELRARQQELRSVSK